MAVRTRWGPAWLYGVLVALAIVSVIGLTIFRHGASRSVTYEQDDVPSIPGPAESMADQPKPDIEGTVASSPALAGLTPADVMGNRDCIMRPGAGPGRDLATVVVPGEDGSRFAVVDGSGVVFSDVLPFYSTRDPSLARRPDGSVLAGFAGRTIFGQRGVVVYQDGQVLFESRIAGSFDLADGGSSFYVMEPMAGNVSRLVIRDLDLGLETHHDLGDLQAATDGYAGFARYSVDESEVVIQPSGLFFLGEDRPVEFGFFPTDGGEPRQLRTSVQESGMARFVSSNVGYFALRQDGGLATVKREYAYDGGEVSVEERWSRDLGML